MKMIAEIDLEDMDLVECTLYADCISKKMKTKKTISLSDFKEMLSETKIEAIELRKMPRFPQGMIDLNWYDDHNYEVTVFVPEQVHPTAYLKEGNERFLPFPNLVFFFKVEKGAMVNSNVYAVKEKRARNIVDETTLYQFPYGNVWGNGKICWGSNSGIFQLKAISDLENSVATFFNATMNSDLYNREWTTKKFESLEELLNEMAGKDRFPSEMLSSTHQLYGMLMNR